MPELTNEQMEIASSLSGVERSRYVRRMGRKVILPVDHSDPSIEEQAESLPVRRRRTAAKPGKVYVCARCGHEASERDPAAWCPACGLGKLVSSGVRPVTRAQMEKRLALLSEAERITVKMEIWSVLQNPTIQGLLQGRYKFQQLATLFEALNVATRERADKPASEVPF